MCRFQKYSNIDYYQIYMSKFSKVGTNMTERANFAWLDTKTKLSLYLMPIEQYSLIEKIQDIRSSFNIYEAGLKKVLSATVDCMLLQSNSCCAPKILRA